MEATITEVTKAEALEIPSSQKEKEREKGENNLPPNQPLGTEAPQLQRKKRGRPKKEVTTSLHHRTGGASGEQETNVIDVAPLLESGNENKEENKDQKKEEKREQASSQIPSPSGLLWKVIENVGVSRGMEPLSTEEHTTLVLATEAVLEKYNLTVMSLPPEVTLGVCVLSIFGPRIAKMRQDAANEASV